MAYIEARALRWFRGHDPQPIAQASRHRGTALGLANSLIFPLSNTVAPQHSRLIVRIPVIYHAPNFIRAVLTPAPQAILRCDVAPE